jgi:hypothetical protein
VLDANGLPVYGLDAELKKKLDGKWDPAVLVASTECTQSAQRSPFLFCTTGSSAAAHCGPYRGRPTVSAPLGPLTVTQTRRAAHRNAL